MPRAWRFVPISAAAIAFVAVACSGDRADSKGEITMKGTVHEVTQTDGTRCWQFTSAKGNNYEFQPAQVPQGLLVDGEEATIVAKKRSGFSFCKVGQLVDVVSATPLSGA
jgi:hypothetical protein